MNLFMNNNQFSAAAAFLALSCLVSTLAPVTAQDLPPLYPEGTRVYGYFDDCECWFKGRVDSFVSGDPALYTVRWSDGTTTDYFDSDLDKLMTVVNHAADFIIDVGESPDDIQPQIFAEGTPVYYHFADDQGWYYGSITDFEDGEYTVEWSDGSTQDYDDLRQVKVMVTQAIMQTILGGDDPDVSLDIGTPMKYKFPKNWWDGEIADIDSSTGAYTVEWTDGSQNTYTDVKALKQMADQAVLWKVGKEDEPVQVFPEGTLVYTTENKKGKVTKYDRARYEVTYGDGDVQKYGDLAKVLELVNQAADLVLSGGYKSEGTHPNPYPVGTRLYYHFPDGWYNGHVSNFDPDNNVYRVTWSDFSIGEPEKGLPMVKQMVAQAAEQVLGYKPDLTEKFDIGTPIYYKFDDAWYTGAITAFEDGWYTASWEDGTTNTYDDVGQVKQMVEQAATLLIKQQKFPIGTAVYTEFDDGWFEGRITGFTNGKYEITYTDDSVFNYANEERVQEMVDKAEEMGIESYAAANSNGGVSGGIVAVIVLAILVVALGIVFIVIRRKRSGKEPPPPPPRGSPEKVSGTGENNIADLKATSSDII